MKTIILATVLVLSACATHKSWITDSGSRADATVTLSYTYDANFERPIISIEDGIPLAIAKCTGWGYRSAEAFRGSLTEECLDDYCFSRRVTATYQCISP